MIRSSQSYSFAETALSELWQNPRFTARLGPAGSWKDACPVVWMVLEFTAPAAG
jgi:hypothetical protein